MEKKHTLLIVDDEPFNLDILQEHLEDQNYAVVRAENGREALTILEENTTTFSAVLLDRMMPHMDGLEVLKHIKEHQLHKQLPVIIQTAAASAKDVKEGIEAGAFYYLTKPFDPEVLLAIVNSAILDSENLRATTESKQRDDRLFSLVKSIELEFRSISDAQNVAGKVSNIYPEPDRVILGLSELLINAVEHGNLGITYEEKSGLLRNNTWSEEINHRLQSVEYKDRFATLKLEKYTNEIIVYVNDMGSGFDWKDFLDMDTERAYDSHGRGIAMASLMSFDTLEFLGCGNTVRCVVKISDDSV